MLGSHYLGGAYLGKAPFPFPTAKYLVAAPGVFALTGTAAALRADYRLSASSGSFLFTGSAVTLTYLTLSTIKVNIGGVDRTLNIRHGSLEVEDVLNDAPNQCTFTVVGLTPAEGQAISVTRGPSAALEFAGNILKVQQFYEQIPANVAFHVTAQDYTWKLNRRLVTKRWTNTSATTIAQEIISGFTTGFTSAGVAASLAVLPEFECVLELPSLALSRLAAEIAGHWYVDYALDLHFFLTEATSAPDDISDALLATTTARALTHAGDLSQARTRVIGIGGGSSCEANVAVSGALVPLKDASMFAGATMALCGPNIITFGAKHDGGIASTVVGNTTAPVAAPSAAATANVVGNLVGDYLYKIAFGNAHGETAAGPATSPAVTAAAFAAPGAGSVGAGSTIGRLIGAYGYKATFVTALGETPGGNAFTRTGVATTTPSAPSVAVVDTGVNTDLGNLIGAYGYKTALVSAFGESVASSAGSRTAAAQTAPAAPTADTTASSCNNGPLKVGLDYKWKIAFVGPDGKETLGTASSTHTPAATVASAPSIAGDGTGNDIKLRVAWRSKYGESQWSAATTDTDHGTTITVTPSSMPSDADEWVIFSTGSFVPPADPTDYFRMPTLHQGTGAQVFGDPAGSLVTAAAGTMGKKANLTSIPVGPTGTIARRIYRTKGGGSTYFLVGELGDNSTTTWTDELPDDSLAVLAPIQNRNGEQHTVSSIATGPTGTTKRYIYRTEAGGSTYYFLREIPDNATTSFVDNATDAELDKGRTPLSTSTMGDQHALTSIPTGPTGTLARNIYRTEAGGSSYKFLYQLTDNVATTYTDNTADADLGEFIPLINTAGGNKISLTSIPTGGATVTQRHIYRTEAGGSDYKYVDTIDDNTTSTYIDNIPDESLGRLALTVGTIGAVAGDTTLTLASVSGFPTTGWVQVDSQMVSYTGISGATLTGIPASGSGALLTGVRGGVAVVTMPFLSGCSGVLYAIDAGAAVRLYLVRNDSAAQTALAALEGGDGIHEGTIDDPSIITISGLTTACDAELTGYKSKHRAVTFQSRDYKLRSGKTVTLSLSSPTSQSGSFLIQRVVSRDFDTIAGEYPLRDVSAEPIRLSFRDVLRRARALTP